MKYYLEDVREVFKRTESSENGLAQSEAERRLEKYGKNKLPQYWHRQSRNRSSGGFLSSLQTR